MLLSTLASLAVFTFTLPSTSQLRIVAGPDPDSTYVYCDGGPQLFDLGSVRLYASYVNGGGFSIVDSHSALGREGEPDYFVVDPGPGSHYYVTAIDTAGNESCASGAIWIEGTQIVGVPLGVSDPVVSTRLYDVQGRLVHRTKVSGVYFRVVTHRSGARSVRRVVVVK